MKAALVTGGSRGIGAAISKRLARDGFFVYVNFSKSEALAQAVVDEIVANGGQGEVLGFDVAQPTQVKSAFERIESHAGTRFDSLGVLVNNAGINRDSLMMRTKDDDIDGVIGTNLKGSLYCCRAATRLMLKQGGAILFTTSVVGEMGNPGQAVYSATKAALHGLTKSLAKELASRKIRVNAVAPGYVLTEMTENLTAEQKEGILRAIPLGQFGAPEDIADAVSFMASEKSRYITGHILSVNGGLYL